MTVRFIVESFNGRLLDNMEKATQRIKKCAIGAIQMAAEEAKKNARASIASGGFSERFQKAVQARVYPNDGTNPAAVIKLKIKYGAVFETGMVIGGKPILWLALPSVPLGIGSRRLSPGEYVARIGKLISVNNPGRPPMLFGQDFSIKRLSKKKVSYKSRKVNQDSLGQLVPMYVGVSTVHDPKKYDVIQAIKEAGNKIPDYYVKIFEMTENG